MTESDIRNRLKSLTKDEMKILLASYLLKEKGLVANDEKIIREVIEENFMDSVSKEDLKLEIINSIIRQGSAARLAEISTS